MSIEMTDENRDLQNNKMSAEIAKLIAETAKINTENRWYVAIIASSATLAIVAIVKLFL